MPHKTIYFSFNKRLQILKLSKDQQNLLTLHYWEFAICNSKFPFLQGTSKNMFIVLLNSSYFFFTRPHTECSLEIKSCNSHILFVSF